MDRFTDRLNGAVLQIVADQAFRAQMAAQGIVFQVGTPEQPGALVRAGLARWQPVVAQLGLRLD